MGSATATMSAASSSMASCTSLDGGVPRPRGVAAPNSAALQLSEEGRLRMWTRAWKRSTQAVVVLWGMGYLEDECDGERGRPAGGGGCRAAGFLGGGTRRSGRVSVRPDQRRRRRPSGSNALGERQAERRKERPLGRAHVVEDLGEVDLVGLGLFGGEVDRVHGQDDEGRDVIVTVVVRAPPLRAAAIAALHREGILLVPRHGGGLDLQAGLLRGLPAIGVCSGPADRRLVFKGGKVLEAAKRVSRGADEFLAGAGRSAWQNWTGPSPGTSGKLASAIWAAKGPRAITAGGGNRRERQVWRDKLGDGRARQSG